MIFKPPLIRAILAGTKTQTRRPIKRGETHCRYRPGRTYAIQPGRGQPSNGNRIEITDVTSQMVGQITYQDARAEGFRTRADFADYWMRLHDQAWRDQWQDEAPSEQEILQRFETTHAHKHVWVIHFQPVRDAAPRLLADPASGRGDYTDNPARSLRDEPEAVDETTLLQFGKDATARNEHLERDEFVKERRQIEASLQRLELALTHGQAAKEIRHMRARLRTIDRILKQAA